MAHRRPASTNTHGADADMTIRVEGLAKLLRELNSAPERLAKQLRNEFKLVAAEVLVPSIRSFVAANHLSAPGSSGRGRGGLERGIRPFAVGTYAGARETAVNPKSGYQYPKRWEFGDRGASKLGPRAFMNPGLAASRDAILARLAGTLDRVLAEKG